jgi:HPt (histidine-containing phosphotransfer) domain-containing protein
MSESLIDLDAWEVMKSMTDAAFLAELIDVFCIDTPELIEQMRAGLSGGDIELVRRAAHSLKSNSASFGAIRLTEAARELEMKAKGGSIDDGEAALARIEVAYASLRPVLEEMKNEC